MEQSISRGPGPNVHITTGRGANLNTLPVEIISDILARIMCNCTHDDLHDLYKTVRACKRLYNVFMDNRAYLLARRDLVSPSIHPFPLALAAVRATNAVENALRFDRIVEAHDILFETCKLRENPSTVAPTLSEFSAVMRLNNVTEAFRGIVLVNHGLYESPPHRLSDVRRLKLQPVALNEWRRRFHISMYRLIIVGAALSGAYLEPFLQTGIPQPHGFLERILGSTLMYVQGESNDSLDRYEPTREDLEYFSRFPLYRYRHRAGSIDLLGKETEHVFKPVADWLLADMKYEEMDAKRRSLSPDTILARAQWLYDQGTPSTKTKGSLKRFLQRQREDTLKAIDSVPLWPVHRQIQQIVRMEQELSTRVVMDRWGSGLLTHSPDSHLHGAITMRRADGSVNICSRYIGFSYNEPENCNFEINTTRVVRHGLFRPEHIVAHICKNEGCCDFNGRSWLSSRAAHRMKKRTQRPVTSNFEKLFGGIPGRVLRLERIFFFLSMMNDGGVVVDQARATSPPPTIHPGIFTYMQKLPEAHAPEDEFRLDPRLEYDVFFGDVANVMSHIFTPSAPDGPRPHVDDVMRTEPFEAIPGSYTIF